MFLNISLIENILLAFAFFKKIQHMCIPYLCYFFKKVERYHLLLFLKKCSLIFGCTGSLLLRVGGEEGPCYSLLVCVGFSLPVAPLVEELLLLRGLLGAWASLVVARGL